MSEIKDIVPILLVIKALSETLNLVSEAIKIHKEGISQKDIDKAWNKVLQAEEAWTSTLPNKEKEAI